MQPTDKSENNRLMSALAILWTLIIASALIWNTTDIKKEIYQESKQENRQAKGRKLIQKYRTENLAVHNARIYLKNTLNEILQNSHHSFIII